MYMVEKKEETCRVMTCQVLRNRVCEMEKKMKEETESKMSTCNTLTSDGRMKSQTSQNDKRPLLVHTNPGIFQPRPIARLIKV